MPSNVLSICIPTYNFGKFIGQTLDSITSNLIEGVEIVILDAGSSDDTDKTVAQRQKRYPQIKFHQQGFRGGIDNDIAKVISLSTGKYCWLISADDTIKQGAVKKVLDAVHSECDIYLCEQTLCDFDLHPLKEHPIFNDIIAPEMFNLGIMSQRKRYFQKARTSEAFFSFLSTPIFKKTIWDKAAGIPQSFNKTSWGIAGRFLSLVPQGLRIYYLNETLIYKRGDNDSFRDQGMVNRLRISVEGFSHIAETIFGDDSQETYHIRRVVRNEWKLRIILSIKFLTSSDPKNENAELLKNVVSKHYRNAGFINYCKYLIYLLTPIPLLRLVKGFRQFMK